MGEVAWQLVLLQGILLFIVLGVMVYALRLYRALKLEKRFEPFAIEPSIRHEVSFLTQIGKAGNFIIRQISKVLNKSVVISKYGHKYDRFITFEEKDKKQGIDYVSLKFLIMLMMIFLSLFTLVLHFSNFSMMTLLVAIVVSFFLPDVFLTIQFNKKRKKIEGDLLKAIIIMNNAFQSGKNIIQAIENVKNELDGPIEDEFKKIYLDITYGLSLDVVFNRFYERVKIEDAKYITASLTLLNKTGGNIVKVFSMIEKSFFDKKKLKDEFESMTAASVFVFRILVFLPFVIALLIFILNPSYFKPFFTTGMGRIALLFILVLYCCYILVVKKVMKVEL